MTALTPFYEVNEALVAMGAEKTEPLHAVRHVLGFLPVAYG